MAYIQRYIGRMTNPSTSSNTQTLALPREHFYSRLLLRVVLPTSSSANYVAGGEDLAINRIEVTINGQLTLKSFSFAQLVAMNKYQNQVTNVDKVAVTAAKTAGYSSAFIDFSLTRKDTSCLLPSHLYSTLDLKLTWDAQTAYGGTELPYCDVTSFELINEGQKSTGLALNKESALSLTPSATGYSEINMPIGNAYRRILLLTTGGATGTGVQNDVITDIEVVQDGVSYHKKSTFLDTRSKDKLEFHLETLPTGTAMLGFDALSDVSQAVDTSPFSSWKLRLNFPATTNTATATAILQELILPRAN